MPKLKILISVLLALLIGMVLATQCFSTMMLSTDQALPIKKHLEIGADAETFAVFPLDFREFTRKGSPSAEQFSSLLKELGRPVLRLASMQRWDWRGEKETRALVGFRNYSKIPYPYFTAHDYYEMAKENRIRTIPMLDVRYFYDERDGVVKNTANNAVAAAAQYAAPYANFVKSHNYDIAFWEIGNEEYMKGQGHTPNADDYAKVVRYFIDAIRQVDPNARFGIQLNDWNPEWRKWSDIVLARLKGYEPYIDYAVIHYYSNAAFTDAITNETISYLRRNGFYKTKLAITEWRHDYHADTFDQEFRSASTYARYLLFLIRHPDIEVSCIHAFGIFGGLAEWSSGRFWSSYDPHAAGERRKDLGGHPRWRLLPFGMAQRLIMDATYRCQLLDYRESRGELTVYLFRKESGAYSMVIVNESAAAKSDSILFKWPKPMTMITGKKLVCPDANAVPREAEPQPWQVLPVTVSPPRKPGAAVDVSTIDGGIKVQLEPYQVMTLNME